MINMWTFEDTGEAYDRVQCDDNIKDGDILLIPNESVVGIAHTYPVALTQIHGHLHTLKPECSVEEWAKNNNISEESLDLARKFIAFIY